MKNIKIAIIATALLTLTSVSYAQSIETNISPTKSKKVFVKNVKASQIEGAIKSKDGKFKNKNLTHKADKILPVKNDKTSLKAKHVSI